MGPMGRKMVDTRPFLILSVPLWQESHLLLDYSETGKWRSVWILGKCNPGERKPGDAVHVSMGQVQKDQSYQ